MLAPETKALTEAGGSSLAEDDGMSTLVILALK